MEYNPESNDGIITSKVYLDKEGIIHVDSIGSQTKNEVLKVRKKVLKLGETVHGKMKIITNLTNVTNVTSGSRKATVESVQLEEVGKIAIFGASTFNRVVASFIIKASGMVNKVQYFKNEEEALKWLKEGK
jgi:hypothetical protein